MAALNGLQELTCKHGCPERAVRGLLELIQQCHRNGARPQDSHNRQVEHAPAEEHSAMLAR